jgi:DNA-binding MarR family transcriptional regulator
MVTIEDVLRLSNRMREYYGRQLKNSIPNYVFSPNEISILILLDNNSTITTSTQLRIVLGVSKALISRSVDSLMKKGLIQISEDDMDKRISHIKLTDESKIVLDRIQIEVRKLNEKLFSSISEEEFEHMVYLLEKMNKVIEEVDVDEI